MRHVKLAYQGRLIFFAIERTKGLERLVILTVYKKESQKTPASVIETAMSRMKEWKDGRGKK